MTDQKRLLQILETGHKLERLWSEPSSPEAQRTLQDLISMIEALGSAQSPNLSRLKASSIHLSSTMTSRHLAGFLVAFERLKGQALRDDEFLPLVEVATKDQPEKERVVAPFIAIAENLRSAFNVGAILRTSEAFGAEKVWLTGYTPLPTDEKTARTAMGTADHIPWEEIPKMSDALNRARAEGYKIVALETAERAQEIGAFQWPEKTALLLGNERFGLDAETLSQADHIVRIPLHGRKNSLNVGIAYGIAIANYREQQARQAVTAAAPTAALPKELSPIGIFRSPARFPYEARRQGSISQNSDVGTIELEGGRMFEQALDSLHGFEKIWLIYRFHHNENWKPMVMPPRGPRTKRGVFATRSPYRPNPLGLSCVDLVGIEGRKIFVRGFDLLDETPIYDIKPYLPYADAFPKAHGGWTEGLDQAAFSVQLSSPAQEKLSWLEGAGVSQFREFLLSQLENDPLDEERKRVRRADEPGASHELSYRTWRALFDCDEATREVRVLEIASGYSPDELSAIEDPYRDKATHRLFLRKFKTLAL